jgi:hypothetical protein
VYLQEVVTEAAGRRLQKDEVEEASGHLMLRLDTLARDAHLDAPLSMVSCPEAPPAPVPGSCAHQAPNLRGVWREPPLLSQCRENGACRDAGRRERTLQLALWRKQWRARAQSPGLHKLCWPPVPDSLAVLEALARQKVGWIRMTWAFVICRERGHRQIGFIDELPENGNKQSKWTRGILRNSEIHESGQLQWTMCSGT